LLGSTVNQMLTSLTVRNLAVVESAEIEFGAGLNVVTGETGAGKSVLMGALELALGGRAEASLVREGAREAEVEAVFDGKALRRTVTREGRSRAWIDDESVSVAELRDSAAGLVDVYGPRAGLRLLEETYQREVLDAFGAVRLASYEKAFSALSSLKDEKAALEAEGAGEEEMEFLRFQVGEIEEAGLSDDDETLSERHAAAAHAAEIAEDAVAVTEALGGDAGAAAAIISVRPRLAAMARRLSAAAAWTDEAEEIVLRIQELSRSVADAVSGLDQGEESLDELDARLSVVNKLKRKYHADTVAALVETYRAKKERLESLEGRGARLEKLACDIRAAEDEVRTAAAALTKARKRAAAGFAKAVSAELKGLGFLQATFGVTVEPAEPGPAGADRVTYVFGPNPGEPSRPLASIASSGELARVMLAIDVVAVSRADGELSGGRTLVFDEIDANVGGEAGKAVGERLRRVAARRQVIAITHLPQSAACGERHFVVSKSVSDGRTRTSVARVEGSARAAEIARMLGGENPSDVVRKHAEELLEVSR